MTPVGEVLDGIHERIVAGRMLDAWDLAQGTGVALKDWPAGEARRTAARVASTLGGHRLSRVLNWLNWRAAKEDPLMVFHGLYSRISHTPEWVLIPEVEAFLAGHPVMPDARRADLLAFMASMRAALRDFVPAHDEIRRALDLSGDDPWIHVMHASVLEQADRYEEALEAARRAVALRPRYASAVLQCAENLIHLGRDDEAVALLEEADGATQNAAFAQRLQSIFSEREDPVRALQCLETIERRLPLAEESMKRWIAGRRADFLYLAGDIDGCLEWCDRKGEGFQKRVAERLRESGARQRKRVRLEVPFTRQHAMTCAPATLASLAAYWGRDHGHLAIAEAICHDGTPWHKERDWARGEGFVAREFRLTSEALIEVIDRGVPFTLTTQAVTSAHLQACIGYDARCGVVLLRDPTERHFVEMFLEGLLADHPFGGPRCMVMLPPEEAHRLDGLHLPDEAVYDAHHELLVALDGQDVLAIESALATLRVVGGGSPLVLQGEERVAAWKDDAAGQLRMTEALLKIAPLHASTRLHKAFLLRRLERRDELRRWLEESVARPGADPVFVSELGELLMEDARCVPQAEVLLRRAVRCRRRDGRVYESLARCRAKQQQHGEAAWLRRIAASLSGTFEPYARAYFDSCRVVRRQDEALAFLDERTRRFGSKDGAPWITLAECLVDLDREPDAAAVLERGAAARPDDGGFLLDAGAMMAAWGEPYRSRGLEWIERARGRTSELRWLLGAARTAGFLGDRTKSLRHWRALVERHPRRIEAWRGMVRCVAEEFGEDEAIRSLDEATAAHPEIPGLWALQAEWLRGTKRGALGALDRLLEISPEDTWALRERANQRLAAGRAEEAEADAREALARDPWAAESHGVLGNLLERTGRPVEAAECYREAIRWNVDYTYAAIRLCRLEGGGGTEGERLAFIRGEMERQVSGGEIVPEYQRLAWASVEPAELLEQLRDFCGKRPDLWQTWSARVEQALRMRLDGEALEAATELTTRFPLMPRGWLDLARVHRAAGRPVDEERATSRAVDLSPGWDEAAREHSHVLEVLGRPQEAVETLKRARRHNPLNGANHGYLADALRRLGRRDEAFACLRGGNDLCPHYGWGWDTACRWAVEDGRREEMAAAVEAATARHGHHPWWWPIAADAWEVLGDGDRCIEAVRQGLVARPADCDLRDKLAHGLFKRGEIVESLAACGPVEDETEAPVNLRGRRAWVLIHSGQPAKGVAEMRALLDAEPGYSWGFATLATWFENRGDWQELRDLCQRWLRADPHHTRALACLGLAERRLERPDAAISAFARAFAHDPSYRFVGRELLDLQMETGALAAAKETLATLRHYASSAWTTCDAIELALKLEEWDEALREAGTLLDDPEVGADVIDWISTLFQRAGKTWRWHAWLRERFADAGPETPAAVTAWLWTVPEQRRIKDGKRLIFRLPEGSRGRIAGWEFLIGHLRKTGDRKTLRKWAAKRAPEIHGNGHLWNRMAGALLAWGMPVEGRLWTADWAARTDDLSDLTLLTVAAFHDDHPGRDARHEDAAGEARAEALRRFPDGSNADHLRAGLALHLAARGQIAAAREVMENLQRDRLKDYYGALADAAGAVLAAAEGDETGARDSLGKAAGYLTLHQDLGSIRALDRATAAVAGHVPQARRSARRLRRMWRIPPPQKRPGFLRVHFRRMWFWYVIGFYVICVLIDLLSKHGSETLPKLPP